MLLLELLHQCKAKIINQLYEQGAFGQDEMVD
jgi:hypothetical protein